jgi:hypothetical protein
MAYKKFNDFIVFDPPDVSDYLVGYRELGGEFRSTLQSVTDVVKKYATPLIGGTIFVNTSGNDSSLGNSEAFAFRTIKRGVAKALEISRSISKDSQDFESVYGWGTAPNPVNVFVRAGVYVEDNPIYVPPGVTVVGENLKSVTIIPKNKFYDIFWVNNKTSIQSVNFKEYYSPAYAVAYPELKQLNGDPVLGYPSTRILEATARAYSYYNLDYNKYPVTKGSKASFLSFNVDAGEPIFDPFNIAFLGRYYKNIDGNELFFTSEELVQQKEFWETKYFNLSSGVEKPYILSVPYIQNCSAATNTISANTFDAGGTVYVDGYLADGPVPSIFIQSCEHFNQGGKGIHAVNNGLAHVKDNTTTCCTEAILASDGGTCIVDDTTCSYGLSGLVSIGKSKEPTMVGTLKTDILNTDLTNKFVITNLGSTYSSENQKFPNDKKPYVGQVFQVIDQNYNLVSSGINYLSATNSGTYFVVQSASNLRPAVFPNEGYECDVIIEGTYSINSDTSITSNTFIPSLVDRLNAGSNVLFYTRSSILAYSHIFNNIGTGINYLSATIQSGAIGDEKKETNKDRVGKILYNSQNQSGFNRFGDNVKIDQVNAKIESINLFSNNAVANTLTSYNDINFGSFRYVDQQGGNRPLLNITKNLDDKIISIESINDIGGGNNVRSFYARGNTSLKKALSSGDDIFRISGFAHNGINYPNYEFGANASIRFHAAGDQSSTNAGGYISLWTTKMDTISTTSERMRIADNGYVGINTINPLSALHVEGSVLVTDKFTVSGASTFNSITTNTLSALSAFIDVININQYEISGFDVRGDFEINGNTGFGTKPDPSKRITIFGDLSSKGNFDITGNANISNILSANTSFFNQSKVLYSNNTDLSSYNLSATNAFINILSSNNVLFSNAVVDKLSANNLFAFNSNVSNLSVKELSAKELSATNILTKTLSSDSIISNALTSNSSFFNTSFINELSTYSLSSEQAYFTNLLSLSSNFDYSYIKKTETLYLSALSSNIDNLNVNYFKANNFDLNNLNVSYLSALSADITRTTDLNVSGVIYTTDKNSLHWNSTYSTVSALSALWSDESGDVSKIYAHSTFLTLTGGIINGDLSVLSSFEVGVGDTVLFVSGGRVGINTKLPNVELTVNGSISSNNIIYDKNGNSDEWNSTYTTYNENSASYTTTEFLNNNFLPLSGGTVIGDTQFNKNVTIWGVLSATGGTYFSNTIYSTTSALSVVHVGSDPALYVGSTGTGDIASFYDLDENVEMLHIGGHDGDYPNVGIKTSTPNVDFTVNGEISASEIIYDKDGNSTQWNSTYTSVNPVSSNWNSVYTSVLNTSANWDSAYIEFSNNKFLPLTGGTITGLLTVVGNISSTGLLYGDGSNLTGIVAGDTVATTLVRNNSANWDSVYTTVQSKSATEWDNALANSYTHTNFLPLTGGTITGYISATQDYFSGSNKSVFTPKTNTIGVSAVSNIVVVSVLPVTPDPSTLYIII